MKTFELSTIIGSIAAVGIALAAVEQRQARTEGLVEGLRDAITTRSHQDPPPRSDAG